MSEYRLTPAAQGDVSSIWNFAEERWGTRQAERYVRELQAAIERVAADPELGRLRDEVRDGYRSYACGRHIVFYLLRTGHIAVIRILHQRMDVSQHL